jgi:acetolactate synthase-1/2/3 large subunit
MPNGADLFSRSLKQLGVSHVFALVGDHLNEALQVLDRDGFTIVDTRHESAAVHMADGWARMSGRPALSMVTGGPGHTNSITGIATADATGVPLLAVSGQSHSKMRDRNGFQDMDQLGLARSASKYCASPSSADQIPFYVREAYRAATTGRPGAAHLSIAVDHFTDQVATDIAVPSGSPEDRRPRPDSMDLARALDILDKAARPVVIAGSGCWWAGAGEALQAFIEHAQTPLFTITLARGLVSDEHPLCFGYADATISRGAEEAIKQADVVLVLGKRIDYRLRMGGPGLISPDAEVIQVDIHPEELGLNRALAVGLNSDCRLALEDFNEALDGRPQPDRSDWIAEVQRGCDEYRDYVDALSRRTSEPMHALEFYRQMHEWLPSDATLCWDGGDFVHWGRYVMPARLPGHWMRLGALAGLGVGFPIGLAAQVLRPNQRSIVVTGDGSLGFYLAEMDTAVRFNLPVIIIVGNDGGWGVERELQQGRYDGKTVACELRRTRYDLIMKGFGGDGAHVERPEQIRPALNQALASDKPFVINVEIDGAGSPFTQQQLRTRKS